MIVCGGRHRPDDHDVIDRIASLATSTLANALDDAGYHDNVMPGLHSVATGSRFAGPAVTAMESYGEYGEFGSEDFKVGAIIAAAQVGDVIVIDGGGGLGSTWGGMASYAAKLKGIAGVVVDGSVRDLEEIIEFDFPVFARHLVPTSGRMRLKVETINEPIIIYEVRVEPGDIIVGDGTGVVCLPRNDAENIVSLAEQIGQDDASALKDIKAGMSFSEAMAKYTKI
jgi:regulator of RNase E activity RraA